MHPQRIVMLIINVLGGAAVLGSYAHGIVTHGGGAALWGGIPASWRTPYSACMPAAAVGYLLTWTYLNFRLDPRQTNLGRFNLLYVAILVPSALWMPLTFWQIEAPRPWLWVLIRGGLGLTGLAALGMITALLVLDKKERPAPVHHALAVAGSIAFAVQTALLDALIWPLYFPYKG